MIMDFEMRLNLGNPEILKIVVRSLSFEETELKLSLRCFTD